VTVVLACAGVAAIRELAVAPTPGLAAAAARVDPGLADVTATLDVGHARSEGTGIVLTSTGEVLTNNHVIAGATSIMVTDVGNGRTYPAAVAGYDRQHDIALLRLQGASGAEGRRPGRLGRSHRGPDRGGPGERWRKGRPSGHGRRHGHRPGPGDYHR